jgi:hypothetical protein
MYAFFFVCLPQAGELSMLRTKLTDTDASNRALVVENNQAKDALRDLKARYDMDVFKATIKNSSASTGARSWATGGMSSATIPASGSSSNAVTSMLLGGR